MSSRKKLFKLGSVSLYPVKYKEQMKVLPNISLGKSIWLAALLLAFSYKVSGDFEEKWTPALTYPGLIEKAQSGSTYFQGLLGIYLRAGEAGSAVNLSLAKQWSSVSAKKNHPFGLYNLANLAMHDGDFELATQYYQDAALRLERLASSGDAVSLFCMGEIDFQVIPTNIPRAIDHFRKSAELGFPLAQATLGSLCLKGLEIPDYDIRKGINLLSTAARSRSLSARFNLGMAYYNGDGVLKDASQASRWFRLAVKQNFSEAQYTLGVLLLEGDENFPKKEDEGVRLLKLAAAQNHLAAKEQLYKRGMGTPPRASVNSSTVKSTIKMDAIQLEEARKYYAGVGVPQDYERALPLFRSLARGGNAEAARFLGLMLLTGRGCEKDVPKAESWLRQASASGDKTAIRILSEYAVLFN
jgi:TPR repeat protein